MAEDSIYCLDTSSLVDIFLHYPADIRRVGKIVKKGLIKIPLGVNRELYDKDDQLHKAVNQWVEKSGAGIDVVRSNPQVKQIFGEVQRKYGPDFSVGNKVIPGLFRSKRGHKSAEVEVIAFGKFYRYTVVSDDKTVRSVCMLEGIECISWQEFRRRFKNFASDDPIEQDLFSGAFKSE